MKINKITLGNIRSYKHQEIEFPSGTVLLSGEVGSGKSSILLALDFVLFGLRPSSLSGGSLLRGGENKGFVELIFELNNKQIKIRRNLKRQGDSIVQEPGFIIIDEKTYVLSPVELKERVLSLLKYPKELLMKSKSLIYRYTVYTPQEEMKQILLGDKDFRLETLRKVFGIDKYKRTKNNTIIYINHLKGLRKELAGKIADLDERVALKKDVSENISRVDEKVLDVDKRLKDSKVLMENKDKEIGLVEDKINLLKELQNQIDVFVLNLENKQKIIGKNSGNMKDALEKIKKLESEVGLELKVDEKKLSEKENEIKLIEEKVFERNSKLGGLKNKILTSQDIKNRIGSLDVCPLCKQKVTKAHISEVILGETKKIDEAQKLISILNREIENFNSKSDMLKKDLEGLKKQVSLKESFEFKKKVLEEKKSLVEQLRKENLELEKEINLLKKNNEDLNEKIKDLKNVKENYELLQEERKRLSEENIKLEVEKGSLGTELGSLKKRLGELEEEIKAKGEDKKELLYWTKIQNWLTDYFVKLMDVIEKKILSRVHYDFDSLFQKWFRMLIDNELIKVNLDEEFTPVIEQNGHVIDYGYLSGGEKTSAALAYRLALNQVINVLIGVIETKDLIILDEPTDGFSDTQLDRMRDVLRELDIGQTILVSHESKVESFVDSVLRIDKKEHVSEIFK